MNPPDLTKDERKARARVVARPFLEAGDYRGAFDAVYRRAGDDTRDIPWAELRPNPHLVEWLESRLTPAQGESALVLGCGLGDDAEHLAARGYRVTAFDLSEIAIDWCRRRFPDSSVAYQVRDLFQAPAAWRHAFDLVVEIYTLQALPESLRREAIPRIAEWVAGDGLLLIVCRGRGEGDPPGEGPWPLTRTDLAGFEHAGLTLIEIDDFLDVEDPPVRRFRATFHRPCVL